MSNSFFAGLESFIEENPVDTTESIQSEDQIEIQQDIADAKEDIAEFDRKIERSMNLLCQLAAMHEHIEKYGVDRTFLAMFNKNDELSSLLKCELPSCEAFDVSEASDLTKICCESINNAVERFIAILRDDLMREFTAIRRAYQSWTSDVQKSKNVLNELKKELKNINKLPDIKIKAYSVEDFKKWVAIKPHKLRKNALDALHDMQSWSFGKGTSERGSDIADSLEDDIELVEKAEPEKFDIVLNSWTVNELNAAIDYCIRACESIDNSNKTYEGYWRTGFNQGKLRALFGGLLGGIIGGLVLVIRKNIIRVARSSWRNMNTLCSIDDALIHTVIRMAKTVVNQ